MSEAWMPIIGFESKYHISDLGNVKSLERRVGSGKGYIQPERILVHTFDSDRYHQVSLSMTNRKTITKKIHRLVAIHFIDSSIGPDDLVCHRDGDIDNNAATNLYIGDVVTNSQDRFEHGTTKLTRDQVLAIRSLLGTMPQWQIGKMFNIRQCYVSQIKNGNRCKTIQP